MIGGRTTHPTTVVPGGFAKLITTDELKILKDKILARVGDLTALVETIVSLASDIPVFDRPTEYVALHSDEEYGLYDGCIQTVMPDGSKEQFDVRDYKKVTNEWVSPNSTAKYTRHNLESYAAGALARFNNNYKQLHPEAKKIAEVLGMKPIVGNPYLNSAAQVVECAHNVHESLRMIDEILAGGGIKEEGIVQPVKFSSGTGSTEVPRGILFHEYNYDENGFCIDGNCIIPTNQNHANIQADFDKLVPELLEADKTKEEMELALEMLVRAYDPCISCSTHYLNVEFVG
jgi:coenzyme F420-reducing hydrogenase alpha subunit